ncbi:MAG: hypothetical protein NTW33_02850 [Methanoregula sp.]|nr:hypothetical protein [Methanoregula sp.]
MSGALCIDCIHCHLRLCEKFNQELPFCEHPDGGRYICIPPGHEAPVWCPEMAVLEWTFL